MAVRQLDVQSTSGKVATGKGGDRGSNPLWTTPNNPTRLGNVWDYKPVRDAEITKLLDYFRATMWTKINPTPGKWTNFTLTRDALEKFKIAHSAEVKAQREVRKAEKHAKKGLTPAECERRRIEAMKKKGLI